MLNVFRVLGRFAGFHRGKKLRTDRDGLTLLAGDFSHLASIGILLHKMVQLNVSNPGTLRFVFSNTDPLGVELFWYLIQVASSLLGCLHHTISWYGHLPPATPISSGAFDLVANPSGV
jgi:hypothetical protein